MNDVASGALSGKVVVVTRAGHQAGTLAERLRALGAQVIEIPAIEIVPPESYDPLDNALRGIAAFEWLVVTSVNAVSSLTDRMRALNVPIVALSHLRVAAVGSATRAALEAAGLPVVRMAAEFVAESLMDAFEANLVGQRILLVRAAAARDVLPGGLRDRGATVEIVDAYRTVIPPESAARIRELAARGRPVDAITFTSSSTVTNFLALLAAAGVARSHFASAAAISIGPITTGTLLDVCWAPAIEADPHNLEGLTAAVVDAFAAIRPAEDR